MAVVQKTHLTEYVSKILLIAVGSYAFGKLGQTMATPPVYATILWPPSGIALAVMLAYGARMWPGVFLSALFLNSPLFPWLFDNKPVVMNAIWVSFALAAGATLQALAANYLIRRFFTMPISVNRLRDATLLLLLAGPIGCALSPTIGVAALVAFGHVQANAVIINWLTWWAGDTFGVIVFLPLTLLCTGTLGNIFALRRDARLYPAAVLVALVIPLLVTLAAWKQATNHGTEKASAQFNHLVLESERAMMYRMDSYEQALLSAIGLFAGSENVRRVEWRHFATALGAGTRLSGILGIGYIADVQPKDVGKFVAKMKQDGTPTFTIDPPPQGDEFFIIKYIEPEDLNGVSLGLNIAHHATRREAALRARDTGKAAVTGRIGMLQDKNRGPGFILMLPHYKNDVPLETIEDRRRALLGWIYAPFNSISFMSGLTVSQGVDFDLAVYDDAEETPDNLLYASGAPRADATYTVRKNIDIRQQKWTFVWTSTASFEKKESGNEPTIVLIAGVLFTGLLGVLLIMQGQRTETVERMVEMRTAELTEREAHLAQVVDKLTESNVELERFAYVVSHDMQEPIRMVANFSSLLWHQYQDRMDPAGQKYLSIITDGAKRLQAMIADLLEYARVGQGARGRETVDCNILLQYVLENLNFVIYEHEAKVTHGKLHSFQGYPVQIMSLLQNFINNAIKYQPKGGRPEVHIASEDLGEEILFSVRDNGIGIDPDSLEKIFEPFKRLHSYQEYSGTGLGLAVCKKIVTNHGGRVWVESVPGQGSTFFFTIRK